MPALLLRKAHKACWRADWRFKMIRAGTQAYSEDNGAMCRAQSSFVSLTVVQNWRAEGFASLRFNRGQNSSKGRQKRIFACRWISPCWKFNFLIVMSIYAEKEPKGRRMIDCLQDFFSWLDFFFYLSARAYWQGYMNEGEDGSGTHAKERLSKR